MEIKETIRQNIKEQIIPRKKKVSQVKKQASLYFNSQTAIFKEISNRRTKAIQIRSQEKLKSSCFWKLADKLQNQLRQLKNHHTEQAREKLTLLQKCRNQKHIRMTRRETRPSTAVTNYSAHHPSTSWRNRVERKTSEKRKKKEENFEDRIEKIKTQCTSQQEKLQQIKDNIDTALYYCKIVNVNSFKIISKLL